MEFDILDRETSRFLSTRRRHELLDGSPLCSVPVLSPENSPTKRVHLEALVGHSLYKTAAWKDALRATSEARGLDEVRAFDETDPSDDMEGLYIKVENDDEVIERYKFIRPTFLTSVIDSGSHWLDRPIIPNQLAAGRDIFGAR